MKLLGLNIAVLIYGWVIIGTVSKDGDEYRMENACIIRVWGTTTGLGEIAKFGPTGSTKLDPLGVANFSEQAKIMLIACDEKIWGETCRTINT